MGQLPKEDGMSVGLRDDPPQGSCRPKLPKARRWKQKGGDPLISARVGEAALAAGSASFQETKRQGSQVAPGTSWYGVATWQLVDASADHEMDNDAEHMADVVVNRGPSASECPSNV